MHIDRYYWLFLCSTLEQTHFAWILSECWHGLQDLRVCDFFLLIFFYSTVDLGLYSYSKDSSTSLHKIDPGELSGQVQSLEHNVTRLRWEQLKLSCLTWLSRVSAFALCHHPSLLGSSGRVVNSLDFCLALSPVAAFTSGAYFLRNGRRWQWFLQILHCQLQRHFWRPVVRMCMATSNNLLFVL